MDNPTLDLFDGHLRSALSRITNTSLSDTQWLQASLSIKHGGLEIRQLRSLALPAFFASAASSSDLQSQILLASACTADTQFHTYVAGQAVGLGRTKKVFCLAVQPLSQSFMTLVSRPRFFHSTAGTDVWLFH